MSGKFDAAQQISRFLVQTKANFTRIYPYFVAVLYVNLRVSAQKFAHDLLVTKRILYAFDLLVGFVALA